MPPPLAALGALARLDDHALGQPATAGDLRTERRQLLYELLRREQALAAAESPQRSETSRILDFAQAAHGDLVGLLVGRDDTLLDTARDGEWNLRDILRHAMAVELRYAAQVDYSATRAEGDPVPIKPELLPCDRLSPPEPEYASSRRGGIEELLSLLGRARERTDARLDQRVRDDALTRPSLWGTLEVDVRVRLHQIAAHLVQTTVQIEKIVEARGEARAIVRRCCAVRGSHERWSEKLSRAVLDDFYRELVKTVRQPADREP